MLQKIKTFLAQFNLSKHTIAAAYLVFITIYMTDASFKNYVQYVYGLLPHWLTMFIAGFVLPIITYYNIGLKTGTIVTTPGSAATPTAPAGPATTTVVKRSRLVLASLSAMFLLPIVGCTSTTTTQAVKDIVAYAPTVNALAQEGLSLAQLFDPADQAAEQVASQLIATSTTSLVTIGNAYLANPSTSGWQSIVTLVDTLVTTVDKQLLAANKITNPQSQQKAIAILGALDLAVHVIDSYVQHAQPPAAVTATAAARTVKLSSVSHFWPQGEYNRNDLRIGEALGF